MILSNFHTHTTYCDGKSSCVEMVEAAVNSGFCRLGFSGHGYTSFDGSFCMSPENEKKYIAEISRLKDKYADKIELLCGVERDLFSEINPNDFDYTIASVHYVKTGDRYYSVDESAEKTRQIINEHYSGDSLKYAEAYYELVSECRGDIIGHFDLITKFNEKDPILDTSSKKYRALALDAVHALAKENPVFELNTGAIARGYKAAPYPESFLLRELAALGCHVVINSDCHHSTQINTGFKNAAELLKSCGFKYRAELTKNGIIHIPL